MMSLPWLLPQVDPSEKLPDDTEWENYDELTLWKQCKLRGLEACVKNPGDALRTLNELKHVKVTWDCWPRVSKIGEVRIPDEIAKEKAFAALVKHTDMQIMQVLHVKKCGYELMVEMADATVTLGEEETACSCGFKFQIGATIGRSACTHILYLERHFLKCPDRLQKERWFCNSDEEEYLANTPPAFRPLTHGRDLNHLIKNIGCRLCFKDIYNNRNVVRCKACNRVAHQICHLICRTRDSEWERDDCPLCCPECPWTRKRETVELGVIPAAVKEELGFCGGSCAAVAEDSLMARKRKFDELKQEEQPEGFQGKTEPMDEVLKEEKKPVETQKEVGIKEESVQAEHVVKLEPKAESEV